MRELRNNKNASEDREELINKIRKVNELLRNSLDKLLYQNEWYIQKDHIEWPGNSAWEIMMGAVLVQKSSWKNVSKVLEKLRSKNIASPKHVLQVKTKTLIKIIKPAGFSERKARTIKELAKLIEKHRSIDALFNRSFKYVRETLLNVYGIGNETADVIMLYAGNMPAMPVSDYTKRILSRVLGIKKEYTYDIWQQLISNALNSIPSYKTFHALMSELGYHYCRPKPRCLNCPLLSICDYAHSHKEIYI
jgi:endonuclease-3 related protein